MTKRLGLSLAVLAFAISAHAVDLEGPAGKTPAPTPTPVPIANVIPDMRAAAGVPDGSLPLTVVPVNLDAASLPQVPTALTQSAAADTNAVPASASANPAAPTAPAESAQAKTAASVAQISAHVAKAAEAAGKSDATGENRADAGRAIEREITGERETPAEDAGAVSIMGVKEGSIPNGVRLERSSKPGEYRARTGFNVLYGAREQAVNPGDVYTEAYYAASLAAVKAGLPARVHLVEVTGSLPLRDGAHASISFETEGAPAARRRIYVDFKRGLATAHGDFDVRVSVFGGNLPSQAKVWPELDDPAGYNYIAKGFYYGPETALDAARRIPRFAADGGASYRATIDKDEKTGDVDVWYKLYDNAGSVVAVNARTLETKAIKAPAASAPRRPLTSTQKLAFTASALFAAAAALTFLSGAGWTAGLYLIPALLIGGTTLLGVAAQRRVDNMRARAGLAVEAPAKPAEAPAPAKDRIDWPAVIRHSGPFALLGLAAVGLWFSLGYALTRDASWALSLIWPVAVMASFVVAADFWSALSRFRRKK